LTVAEHEAVMSSLAFTGDCRSCSPTLIEKVRALLAADNAQRAEVLEAVPAREWPPLAPLSPTPIIAMWHSCAFVVVAFDEGEAISLTIRRTQLAPEGKRADGITWDELQQIKAECGFGERDAVEIYPADGDVSNAQAPA
jgi:hypothetical protein